MPIDERDLKPENLPVGRSGPGSDQLLLGEPSSATSAVREAIARQSSPARHDRCCQCGAVRGTPEHAAAYPDAVIARALAKRSEGYTSRKLSKR